MISFIDSQDVPPNVFAGEENLFQQDEGMSSINQFSMLAANDNDEEKSTKNDLDIDPFGYILYCPCMGVYFTCFTYLLYNF